jgi:hypothetical protein
MIKRMVSFSLQLQAKAGISYGGNYEFTSIVTVSQVWSNPVLDPERILDATSALKQHRSKTAKEKGQMDREKSAKGP